MKTKTEEKNTPKKKTAKKKAATKTAAPPNPLAAGVRKKQGVWVFSTGEPVTHAQMERLRRSIYRDREDRWMGKPRRAQILLPEDLLREIDALVGPRGRSAFLVETLHKEVRRRRLLQFLESKEPAWKDRDHPDLAAESRKWVRKMRAET